MTRENTQTKPKHEPTADGKGDEHLTRTGKIEKRLEELAEIQALKELYGE